MPKDNLLLRKDTAGNWGIVRATPIVAPEEHEPTPADLRAFVLWGNTNPIKGTPITISIEVYNHGELTGTFKTEVRVDGELIKNVDISVEGGRNEQIPVAFTFDKIGDHTVEAAGEKMVFVVRGITEWWSDDGL